MTNLLVDYFKSRGWKVVESSLKSAVGKPTVYVTDDAHYKQAVVQRGLAGLPVQMRLKGDKLRWDELYDVLRGEVFEFRNGHIELVDNLQTRLISILTRFYGGEEVYDESGLLPPEEAIQPTTGPGWSAAAPPPPATVVGIDLGTTFSVVAYVDAQGRPVSIPNAAGDLLTPSVVLFDEDRVIVGKEAVQASALEPEKVAECAKRDMGAKFFRKKINGEYIPPEVISSFVLRVLKADAERKLGPVDQAVITVPAYFDETRRRATVDAGKLAGLQVLDIINEPTAAAIAYGYQLGFLDRAMKLQRDQPLRILVYDLGGGTFDVTIVEIQGNSFKALATDGDVYLGGKDWDEKLIELAAERFKQKFREDPRGNPVSLQELWLSAESAKRTLSERQKAAMYVNHLGSRMKVEVTRQEFEEATAGLLERTRLTTEIVVRQAGLTWAAIDKVLLVGGSTRMPMVMRMLEELSGKPPDRSISPDEAVAHGAALYADMMAAQQRSDSGAAKFTVTNINSHSLGVLGLEPATGRKVNKVLIKKNTPLPTSRTKTFKTFKAGQKSVVVTVLEGESERPEICTQVGVATIKDLPPNLPAGWPVRVTYSYATNGRLNVTAKLKDHDACVTTEFLRENSMPDEDLELWAKYVEEELQE
jgi:molecular chaperone DnaK